MIATWWPYLLAAGVGAALTVQVGMNATVGRAFDSPLWAAVVNFLVGLVALVACAAAIAPRPSAGAIAAVPGWAWFGGLLGALFVASSTVLGPRIGALALVAFVLVGQLGMALVVDQFGVLGFPRATITPQRLVGAGLLVLGAVLVMRR